MKTEAELVVRVGWDPVAWHWEVKHAIEGMKDGKPVVSSLEKTKEFSEQLWAVESRESWRVMAMQAPEHTHGDWVVWSGELRGVGVPLAAILGAPISAGGEVAVRTGVLAALYALPHKCLGKAAPGWTAACSRFLAAYITRQICWDAVGPCVLMDMFSPKETQMHITQGVDAGKMELVVQRHKGKTVRMRAITDFATPSPTEPAEAEAEA